MLWHIISVYFQLLLARRLMMIMMMTMIFSDSPVVPETYSSPYGRENRQTNKRIPTDESKYKSNSCAASISTKGSGTTGCAWYTIPFCLQTEQYQENNHGITDVRTYIRKKNYQVRCI